MTKTPRLLVGSFLALIGSAWLAAPQASADDQNRAAGKKRLQGPVTCSHSEDRVLRNVIIEAEGPAIVADGSCDLLIVDSVIRSKRTAIDASGSSDVVIRSSVVEGARAVSGSGSTDLVIESSEVAGKVALELTGSADAALHNSKFRGRRVVSGQAEIVDGGGNRWTK